jgi:hypothetical protein
MSVARFPVVHPPHLSVRRTLLAMTLGVAAIGTLLGSPPASAAPAAVALTDSAVRS